MYRYVHVEGKIGIYSSFKTTRYLLIIQDNYRVSTFKEVIVTLL